MTLSGDLIVLTRSFKAFSKENSRCLQVLQYKMLRIILKNTDRNTQTRELMNETKELSVHQLGAFHTLHKFSITGGLKHDPLQIHLQRLQDLEPASTRTDIRIVHHPQAELQKVV